MKKNFKKLKNKKQQGVTLVIAITAVTLLLSISLSVSNIVLRQIRISSVNNASKPVFFVADSALNCAFYYDTLYIASSTDEDINTNLDIETSIFGSSTLDFKTEKIKCGVNVLGLTSNKISDSPKRFLTTFDVSYDNMCAKVKVTKTESSTRIDSYGYNTEADSLGCNLSDIKNKKLVERGLTITY